MENDKLNVTIDDLELKITNDTVFSLEDEILVALFKEKGSTIRELIKCVSKVNFMAMNNELTNMENKGFVVRRTYESCSYYYLTSYGASEAEYRFNTNIYFKLYDYLKSRGYNNMNIIGFLKNRFYRFYIEGKWENECFVEQYIAWCESNGLDPEKSISMRRKLK